MATKQKKTARRQRRKTQRRESNRALDFRGFQLRASTVDDDSRTVEAVIASETPVDELDWDRGEMVPRILLGTGAAFGKQIPLLDSHDRSTTRNQLGSIRNIRQECGDVIGTLHFSSLSDEQFTKVREGHITDVSAGFAVDAEEYIPKGKTKTVEGREFTGPINVATRWSLREGSLVPIGADQAAKLRGLDPANLPHKKDKAMNEKLRQLLIDRGMPEDTDDEGALAWLVEFADREPEAVVVPEPISDDRLRVFVQEEVEKDRQERATRRKHVDEMCEIADVKARAEWYDLDNEALKTAIKDWKASEQTDVGPSIRMSDSQPRERCLAAIGTALNVRAISDGAGVEGLDKVFPEDKRSKDAGDFKYASLLDMATECLVMDGHDHRDLRRLSKGQLAQAALGFKVGGLRSNPAVHTTGSFTELTLDAVNKSLRAAYGEAPSTWQGPMRQGPSVADFKDIHRVVMGSVPNLPTWSGNVDPEQASFADAKETYAVECRSAHVSLSYKLLVNDDMSALGRLPGQLGQAAARTVNAVAWSIVTANPTLRDSQALFSAVTGNRKRLNLTTGAGAPSSSTITTLAKLMMLMRGENTPEEAESDDVLALQPAYIIGPAALWGTIVKLVKSEYDPGASNSITYNLTRGLIPVIEPLLDANSATAWYLFASPSQIDTIEVSFLQGQETPAVRSFTDDKTLSQNYIVLQTFGAAALDHRGVQKHAGA